MNKSLTIAIIVIIILIGVVGGYIWYKNQDEEPAEETTAPEVTTKTTDDESMMHGDADGDSLVDAMKNTAPTEDTEKMEITEEMKSAMIDEVFDYTGPLADVTNGNAIRETVFNGNASGTAMAKFEEGTYKLYATFNNLPTPTSGDFYEGWIVRKGSNMSVISTGALDFENDTFTNTYTSAQDLTDHTFYVLTLEPDDGDPAPADHVLEGTLTK